MGLIFESGFLGMKQDYRHAAQWYRLASDQNDSEAQFRLGYFYARGNGVTQSRNEATRLYRLAAAQGHDEAKIQLSAINEVVRIESEIASLKAKIEASKALRKKIDDHLGR